MRPCKSLLAAATSICILFRFVAGSLATQPERSSWRSLAAFAFEINETFRYQYNLFVPWEIDCRIESRGLVPVAQPLACLAARGDPPDEDLNGPAAYSDWLESSSPTWVLHQIEELLDEGLNDEQFRAEARDILANTRLAQPRRRSIDQRLKALPAIDWDAGRLYENADPADH